MTQKTNKTPSHWKQTPLCKSSRRSPPTIGKLQYLGERHMAYYNVLGVLATLERIKGLPNVSS